MEESECHGARLAMIDEHDLGNLRLLSDRGDDSPGPAQSSEFCGAAVTDLPGNPPGSVGPTQMMFIKEIIEKNISENNRLKMSKLMMEFTNI